MLHKPNIRYMQNQTFSICQFKASLKAKKLSSIQVAEGDIFISIEIFGLIKIFSYLIRQSHTYKQDLNHIKYLKNF